MQVAVRAVKGEPAAPGTGAGDASAQKSKNF
jgi:hypothetical protein